ncbi:cysteine-rich receptor-like protein kinase [Tanacetum coccineum]
MRKVQSKGLIFKVDFEKSYDSLNRRFLMDIMKKMGFRNKWCKWIESCLRSSTVSILVNGSPTYEFYLERRVRQGDMISPFLFILAAEGLNVVIKEAVDKGVFRGVKTGRNNVVVSHLQYADDIIFFGELYHLDRRKEGKVVEKGKWVDNVWCWEWGWVDCRDCWMWAFQENGDFTVKELTKLVEEKTLSMASEDEATIWNK